MMSRAVILGLLLAWPWCAAAALAVQNQVEDTEPAAETPADTAAPEAEPAPQTAAAETAPAPGLALHSEEELAARIVELRRRRSDRTAEYNRTYALLEKSRLEAELRRIEALLEQALGEQALALQRTEVEESGAAPRPQLGTTEREAEIVARLAELRRRRRELVDRYNTTYTLREKDALAAEIERTEELIRNTAAELTLSQQAAGAKSP